MLPDGAHNRNLEITYFMIRRNNTDSTDEFGKGEWEKNSTAHLNPELLKRKSKWVIESYSKQKFEVNRIMIFENLEWKVFQSEKCTLAIFRQQNSSNAYDESEEYGIQVSWGFNESILR